jgi:uncharacterized phage protein (TIGR01671 family)
MREIKFRAWDSKEKYMMTVDSIQFPVGGVLVCGPGVGSGWSSVVGEHSEETIVLEQFTGLRDKTDRNMYEGDIVTDPRMDSLFNAHPSRDCWWRGVVKHGIFSVQGGSGGHGEGPEYHRVIGWYYNTITTDYRHVDSVESRPLHSGLVIIGNIHENPELIEQPEHSVS